MNMYAIVKVIHVISATILFGTGIGIAFFKWIVDRSGDVAAIRVVSERVVVADWIFTTPAIVVQMISGLYLALTAGFSMTHGWLLCAIVLFFVAGGCWIPVVALQIRMRDLVRHAHNSGLPLPEQYRRDSRVWFWLGVPAFSSLIAIYWLMVTKPF
jgi:uncharacterized membrane protein